MTASTKTVVVDATVLIRLAQLGRLDILGALVGWDSVVSDQVVEEVTYPEQAKALGEATAAGHLRTETSTDLGELTLYSDLKRQMGGGEAACLAMAATRGWMLASDDRGRAFQQPMRDRVGTTRLIDISRIVDEARRPGRLSADVAQQIRVISGS